MIDERYAFPAAGRKLRSVISASPPALSARIRRTAQGVRVRFSDGRIAWLDRDPNVSESGFLGSVSDWARRHGACAIEVEFE